MNESLFETKHQILQEIEYYQICLIQEYISYHSIKEEYSDIFNHYSNFELKLEELMNSKGFCNETLEFRMKMDEFENKVNYRDKRRWLFDSECIIKFHYQNIQNLTNRLNYPQKEDDYDIKEYEQNLLNHMKNLDYYQKEFEISSKFVEYLQNELEKNEFNFDITFFNIEKDKNHISEMHIIDLKKTIKIIQVNLDDLKKKCVKK